MIYILPVATGTCREVTTCLQRSVELFQLRGVPDANRFNECFMFKIQQLESYANIWKDAFQMCLSVDEGDVLCKTVLSHPLFIGEIS